MSRLYNTIMMQQYGDLELAAEMEQRKQDDANDAAWEEYEAGEDLYNGIIENRPFEFYWLNDQTR